MVWYEPKSGSGAWPFSAVRRFSGKSVLQAGRQQTVRAEAFGGAFGQRQAGIPGKQELESYSLKKDPTRIVTRTVSVPRPRAASRYRISPSTCGRIINRLRNLGLQDFAVALPQPVDRHFECAFRHAEPLRGGSALTASRLTEQERLQDIEVVPRIRRAQPLQARSSRLVAQRYSKRASGVSECADSILYTPSAVSNSSARVACPPPRFSARSRIELVREKMGHRGQEETTGTSRGPAQYPRGSPFPAGQRKNPACCRAPVPSPAPYGG